MEQPQEPQHYWAVFHHGGFSGTPLNGLASDHLGLGHEMSDDDAVRLGLERWSNELEAVYLMSHSTDAYTESEEGYGPLRKVWDCKEEPWEAAYARLWPKAARLSMEPANAADRWTLMNLRDTFVSSTDTRLKERSGQKFTLLGRTPNDAYDRAENESGSMWRIQFEDGHIEDVYGDEIAK